MGEQKSDTYWNYEIEKGDTLWGISAKYEVSKNSISYEDISGLGMMSIIMNKKFHICRCQWEL